MQDVIESCRGLRGIWETLELEFPLPGYNFRLVLSDLLSQGSKPVHVRLCEPLALDCLHEGEGREQKRRKNKVSHPPRHP
ncbi:MAG: hypothetical protein HUU16_08255 [Candidatus Omnitrophica bacterium]|nr:hypothetical protein [Candidatus Omnitrophota bacterium]